jgi:hypothetical protein
MTFMGGKFGRVFDIERKDRKFGGFLTLFSEASPTTQLKILAEINALKEESKGELDLFLEKVEVLAEMYGAIIKNENKGKSNEAVSRLTAKIGEIESAALELMKTKV